MAKKPILLADMFYNVLLEAQKEDATSELDAMTIAHRIVFHNPEYAQTKKTKSNFDDEGLIHQIRREISTNNFFDKFKEKHPDLQVDPTVRPRLFSLRDKGGDILYRSIGLQLAKDILKREEGKGEQDRREQDKLKQESEKQRSEEQERKEIEEQERKLEEQLYPVLKDYMYHSSGYRVYSCHVPHSGNKGQVAGFNKWLYPDLVGLQDMQEDFSGNQIIGLMRGLGQKRFKFWSFEVKNEINQSNIRPAFFQTVANSFWANFAYLVADKIRDEDTFQELRRLTNLHGVGVISLDRKKSSEGQILIPAKEREEVDWDMFYRLVKDNKNYQTKFLSKANDVLNTHNDQTKLNLRDWDIEDIK